MPNTGPFQIQHCTDDEFLEKFRRDLSKARNNVIILSPFLSSNRALNYYPVLQALIARNVSVKIYAKPKSEQPDFIRDNFDNIERRLNQIGVTFLVRPGMHEKVGIVDEKILWHGSLNILSHNSTKESMLRFVSAELVNEIIADLGLRRGKFEFREDLKKVAESKNIDTWGPQLDIKQCPACNGTMHFYDNSKLWICDDSPNCPGTLSEQETVLEEAKEIEFTSQHFDIDCPICNSLMEIRRGIVTRIACTSNSCNFSFDSRLSAGLIRISKKKIKE